MPQCITRALTGCEFCKSSSLLEVRGQSCSMPTQCSKRPQAKNPAITSVVCQAVHRSPAHFSDPTTLVCCCCLLLWPLREAPGLRKTRNQLFESLYVFFAGIYLPLQLG